MVTKVNDMDLNILALFTKGYDKDHYIREVEKLLGISSRTALVTLAKLEKQGILESTVRGKIKTYRIRRSALCRDYFLLAEQYKKIRFLEKNRVIKEVLEKTDALCDGMMAVFGSYAKGTQDNDSDLDVFIVGTHDARKIKEIGRTYGIDISIKSYPPGVFKAKIHDDVFLKEIAENHILIKGAETFVAEILEWTR